MNRRKVLQFMTLASLSGTLPMLNTAQQPRLQPHRIQA